MDDDIKVRSLAVKRQRAKARPKSRQHAVEHAEKIIREVQIPEIITVQELANRMAERAVDVIKELLKLGTMATANNPSTPIRMEIIVETMGHKFKRVSDADVETHPCRIRMRRHPLKPQCADRDHPRPYTVRRWGRPRCSMRCARPMWSPAKQNGITRHIGAYQVTMNTGQKITFLDHARATKPSPLCVSAGESDGYRRALVAADDGIMPQTIRPSTMPKRRACRSSWR